MPRSKTECASSASNSQLITCRNISAGGTTFSLVIDAPPLSQRTWLAAAKCNHFGAL